MISNLPSVEELAEFATQPTGATGSSRNQELIARLRADPRAALERFTALFQWPRASVRAWACYVGAVVCGRDILPALRDMFTDPNQDVQEMVISGIEEIDLDE